MKIGDPHINETGQHIYWVDERSTCEERIRKPLWIAKEKEELVKMELGSGKF